MNLGALLPMLLGDFDMAEETIQNLVSQYKPIIYAALNEGFQAYKDLANNDEYFTQRAQMKRKMYEAYISAGFTEEQAMIFLVDSDAARANTIKQLISMEQAMPNS